MAIERYYGKKIIAEDANDYIDGITITDGCNSLMEAARMLSDIVNKIQELKEDCSSTNLSIQGNSMEPIIEAYEKSTMDFANYISSLADNLSATTQRVVNRKQVMLNEEARTQDEMFSSTGEEII